MKIIRSEETGLYRVLVDEEQDVYLCDEQGNSSWDAYYDAEQMITEWRKLNE